MAEEEEKEEEEIKAINMLRNGKRKKRGGERSGIRQLDPREKKLAKCKVGLRKVIFLFRPNGKK